MDERSSADVVQARTIVTVLSDSLIISFNHQNKDVPFPCCFTHQSSEDRTKQPLSPPLGCLLSLTDHSCIVALEQNNSSSSLRNTGLPALNGREKELCRSRDSSLVLC